MLKEIKAKNLKGQNFTHEVGPKTLIVGPNGSGKTAVLTAINLLVQGYQPGVGKKPMDIMAELATGDKLLAEGLFKVADKSIRLTRRFVSTKAGAKQDYCIDHKKASKDEFNVSLAGVPKPIDLSTFTDLSDDKKIEYLVNLHGAEELTAIDEKLRELREDLNAKRLDMRGKEKLSEELSLSISEIDLPSGTLPEIQAEIKKASNDYKYVRDQLEEARKEQARLEAEAKAKAEAEQQAQAEKELAEMKRQADEEAAKHDAKSEVDEAKEIEGELDYGFESNPSSPQVELNEYGDSVERNYEQERKTWVELHNPAASIARSDPMGGIVSNEAARSIQKILNMMEGICPGLCGAKLVAQMELKKFIESKAA